MKLTKIQTIEFKIENTPCVLYGKKSDRVILYIHGLCGYKEEAERFARIAERFGYCVLAMDLPEHGGRTDGVRLLPWEVVPEIQACYRYACERFREIGVRAESIGAYMTLLALKGKMVNHCLLVSPLTDMTAMIEGMLIAANSDLQTLERVGEIQFGGMTISWKYYQYAKAHSVEKISDETAIISSDCDYTVGENTIRAFAKRTKSRLYEMKGGEHYFHTPEQLAFLENKEEAELKSATGEGCSSVTPIDIDNRTYGISPREYGELKILLMNMQKVHTTKGGMGRISRNLSIDCEPTEYCKQIILDVRSFGRFNGKNLYITLNGEEVTLNRTSYTIITAKRQK